jgi:hypothetical protein
MFVIPLKGFSVCEENGTIIIRPQKQTKNLDDFENVPKEYIKIVDGQITEHINRDFCMMCEIISSPLHMYTLDVEIGFHPVFIYCENDIL